MENKNTIIALVLMLAVWIGFTVLFPPAPPPTPNDTEQASPAGKEQEKVSATPSVSATSAAPLPIPAGEEEIVVENEVFRAVLTNVGGRLKWMELKQYKSALGEAAAPIVLVDSSAGAFGTLVTTGEHGFNLPQDALYSVAAGQSLQLGSGDQGEVVFSYQSPSGVTIEKTYTFRGNRHYDFDLRIRLINGSQTSQSGDLSLRLIRPFEEGEEGGQFEFVGPLTYADGELHQDDVEDVAEKSPTYGRAAVWTAFTDKYFLTAAVPLDGAAERIRIEKANAAIENLVVSPSLTLAPGEATTLEYFLYFGPKDLDLLRQVDYQLANAVDFGFFDPIAKPLLYVLKFFHRFLGNYGLAIILLTVIIKLIFWPLTQKSYSSMKSMQKLQPEMQKIREKYGKDRERLNRELMELYKKNRVNPLGGCLPMVVQIPVFFALYKVLMDAIELRHAPFYFWIADLSAKDPYYISPLIMGASMFIQQKMTPTTMDPTQAKVFMLMPIIFTFMFLNFPSGLVIYWLVNNILTIGQQTWINRKS